jgi:S-formylglutathione hydrolase FrmB
MIAAFGSAKDRRNTPDDNFYMIEQHLKKHTDLPEFYISTGQEDAIAFDNYNQAEWMHRAGLEFIDIRDHGRHNWEYCDKKVKEFLEWIPLKNVFKMEEA